MDFNKVIINKGKNAYQTTKNTLIQLNLNIDHLKDKKILIKPNAGRLALPRLGINTNPDVVMGVIDFLLEAGVKNLAIGESCILGVNALEALEKCGISNPAKKRNIPLINMDAVPPVTVDIPDGKVIDKLKICRQVLDSDYIISVPVMKTHMHTQVSLGIKNMKGCLFDRQKVKLHQLPFSKKLKPGIKPLDMAIADMCKILLPDLTVIDGSIGQEGLGPSAGSPKEINLIITSTNPIAADRIAGEIMGFDTEEIKHLNLITNDLSDKYKHYTIKRKDIIVEPEDYIKWKQHFKRPPKKISLEFKNIKVEDKDSCSACLSTVLMFLNRYYKEFVDYFSEENPLHIALGKGIGKQVEQTFLIGNCTYKQKKGNTFIKGCPPVASQIKKELDRFIKKNKN